MAAAAEDYDLESDRTCSVCLEIFKDPLCLSCKHSFCSSCLREFWKQAASRKCPICRRKSSLVDLPNFKKKELPDVAGRQNAGVSEREETEKKPPVMCSKHPEERKWFCKDEQRAVCPVCEFSLHRSHKVVPVEEAVSELKLELTSPRDKREKWKKMEETYKDMIQFSEKQQRSTERQIRAELNKLHQFLREEEESRLVALREEGQQKRETLNRELKTVQEQISLPEDLQKPSPSDPQLLSGALIDVAKHLGNLSFRVWEKMKEKVRFSPLILDPNTAEPSLYLCDNLASVRHGDTKQNLPDNPERFTNYTSVLGSEGFTSGRHSWEVEVGDHPGWIVGLAKESVERKQELYFSPQVGIWCLMLHKGKYTNGAGDTLRVKKSVQRVRVQLDYELGEVSFYDHDSFDHICTHRDTFTEKLFPYFAVGSADDAKTTSIKIHQA